MFLSAVARARATRAKFPVACRPAYSTTNGSDHEPSDKRRNPPRLMDHAPGWREDLATPSEASVKADHETVTIDEMRKKTVDHVQCEIEAERTHASYARDQVHGPLGNAGVGEFEGVVGNDDLGPDESQVEPNGRVVSRRRVHPSVREGKSGADPANASSLRLLGENLHFGLTP